MYLLRRAAIRSFTASPLQARSIVTKTPTGLRQSQKWQMPVFQARFASNEASPSDAKTTDETVPTENESVEPEAQAEKETNVEEQSVDGASEASQPQQVMEQMKEQVSERAAEAVESVRQTTASAAESLLGKRTGGEGSGTHTEPKPSRILYVGNLFFEVKSQDLLREFEKYGKIVNHRIAEDPRGLSRGFGFVEFEVLEDALKAQEELNQKNLAGRNMAVQFHVRREAAPKAGQSFKKNDNPPSKTLFIGNMSFQMSDKDLNDIFRPIKNVLDVRVAVDRRSGQPRGFCHADFIDVASAKEAMEILGNKEIYGRKLRIDFSRDNTTTGGGPRRDQRGE